MVAQLTKDRTVERLTAYIAQLQPWTIEISTHLQQLMTKDNPGSAIRSPLECFWPREASEVSSQPAARGGWQAIN